MQSPPFDCLSIGLLAGLLKKPWTDLHQNFNRDRYLKWEQVIKFLKVKVKGQGHNKVNRIS